MWVVSLDIKIVELGTRADDSPWSTYENEDEVTLYSKIGNGEERYGSVQSEGWRYN